MEKNIEEEKPLVLEYSNFRVDSDGWEEITIDGKKYRESPEGDIMEIGDGKCKGEQLFTWDAAMKKTAEAGKRMPKDEEWTEILKTKDVPNLTLPGYRDTNGSVNGLGSFAYLWSSTDIGNNACYRYLPSSHPAVNQFTRNKAHGFSVRCFKD